MNITVVGSGYVGLVTGACIAEMGNTVYCVDVDKAKIDNLKQGILPIYEPGLEEIVTENHQSGRLLFTTSLSEAVEQSEVFFIAVGTPPGEDGSADLRYVLEVAKQIGDTLTAPAIVVNKSTVPVGTADLVRAAVAERLEARGVDIEFSVVSNPEFLKEGAAVNDFMHPDRIVIGADNEHARQVMSALYAPFIRNRPRTMFMGIRDAEMTKYAANAMLATKISFMNEIASLCERLDVDVENVRLGIGSDERIGYHFIYAGCGYGGSCFPKDVQALIRTAEHIGYVPRLLKAVEDVNDDQKMKLPEFIQRHFGDDLKGKTFALWGLSFKPNTDDMREASSRVLMDELWKRGAIVQAYDPEAMDEAQRIYGHRADLRLMGTKEAALQGADALVICTEWQSFKAPDFDTIKNALNEAVIFDGRNLYDPERLRKRGFTYYGIGRGASLNIA